jgi:MFS family permease
MTSFGISAVNGLVFGGLLDGSMTIYLNARYGLNSQDAGLVFIAGEHPLCCVSPCLTFAALAPSFVTSPLAGRFVSKYGNRWPIIVSCALTVPFVCLLIVPQLPLAAFIVVLTFTGAASTARYLCRIWPILKASQTVLVPVVAEFSFLPAKIPHLGFAHVFGIFNFSFSCGAFVGPLIAGQILGAVGDEKGWQCVQLFPHKVF